MENHRNSYALILAAMVAIMTIIALLGIWDIIHWKDFNKYFSKSLLSLLVLFISSALVLFIFSYLYKPGSKSPDKPSKESGIYDGLG
jgi:hypothetical protein